MNKFVENWCIGSGGTGTILSLTLGDVKEIVYIVFISIQIFVLLLGITIKFFKFLDDKKIDKNEQDELLKDLDKIHDLIDKENDDDNN